MKTGFCIPIIIWMIAMIHAVTVIAAPVTETPGTVCATAKECYEAALAVTIDKNVYGPEYLAWWRKRNELFRRAIDLDPSFTEAYLPCVDHYFKRPGLGEYDNSRELDELIALLKKGLEYKPKNGEKFYSLLVFLEFKRWGDGNEESYLRCLHYLDMAISQSPGSSMLSAILYNKSDILRKLGRIDQSRNCLIDIIRLNLKDSATESALYQLISDYASEKNEQDLFFFSDEYLRIFGTMAIYSDFALYNKTESSYALGKYDETLSAGNFYIKKVCSIASRADSCKKIYKYFSVIYARNGNHVLSQKYNEMSK